jgi:hypothetical protein
VLVRNHVWTEKLCLFIIMSRMGYIKICPNDNGSCSQYPMGQVLEATGKMYSFLLHIVDQLFPLSIASSVKYIHKY